MNKVNTLSLESNRKIKINFDGGDLSSDAGLLLIKEFVSKLGIDKLFSQSFKTNDSALLRYHPCAKCWIHFLKFPICFTSYLNCNTGFFNRLLIRSV